jgi:hypothetical protein
VVVSFAIVLTTGDGSLNALYSDLQLSLPLPIPHDVTIPMTRAVGEADHLNFGALGLFFLLPNLFLKSMNCAVEAFTVITDAAHLSPFYWILWNKVMNRLNAS